MHAFSRTNGAIPVIISALVVALVFALSGCAPKLFSVAQNVPNPFNSTTVITFTIAKAGHVTIDVFNVTGHKVDTVANASMSAGSHSVTWNASKFSAGVYFYTVKSGEFSKTMKMTLSK